MQDANPATEAQPEAGFDLTPAEIRVLGVLIEKSFITPDAYPLSINAVTTGCNQLTAREPVMSLSEAEVQDAIDSLMARRLVSKRDQASARVPKYEHLVRLRHSLPPAEQAVLAILLLRGAQTAGELRQRCERLHRFDDVAAVEAVLEHLADKYPPLVAALPRAPGTKETRHVHLLGGDAAVQEMAEAQSLGTAAGSARGRIGELEDEVRRLREELEALRSEFAEFRKQFD
ncbi:MULTISPECIES: YceH family protein [unclassified Thauera]|jgi:uncharacterized protein YceH (UPF0502 family)|uniref:YceH family protein n=1 Tax=unclassified Thauera TaxID=2609274 RepID=UPI0002CFECCA|nr:MULTISPECIES: YceH family protein [unclassified Thauera]ENO92372.1 hypothetical protein C662_12707 [Thauera sp. 28]WBL63513.1 YceH family protein [Thauera sp. WB-2]HAG74571.1 DUF480 domain-containing protein [Thauera sp.]HNR61794.1 YceH family protein [Thauera sp.]HNS91757.1 YceH family protein [Thauera sp.]